MKKHFHILDSWDLRIKEGSETSFKTIIFGIKKSSNISSLSYTALINIALQSHYTFENYCLVNV